MDEFRATSDREMSPELPGVEAIVTEPPAIDRTQASDIAERAFEQRGIATDLGGERDRNFHIDVDDGDDFVLKIFNAADDGGVIDFRTRAIEHIHRTDPDLPVLEIVPTRDGEAMTSISEDGNRYFVQLYSFVPGRKVSFEGFSPDALFAYGQAVARMGKALCGYFHPNADYELLWDLRYATELRAVVGHIDDDRRRACAEAVLDRVKETVVPDFDTLRAQVIHNDLGPDNVLFDADNQVSGITDFGDLTYTALVCDLAVVLANVMNRRDDPMSAAQLVVRGYANVTPLDEDELRVLPDLVLARLAVRGIMHAWKHEKYEHNTDNVDELWDSLFALEAIGPEAMWRLLRASALEGDLPYRRIDTPELLSRRREVFGSTRLSYREPVHFVAGDGVWLFDDTGRRYLDAYNNVQVVGHGHPDVAAAIAGQTRTLTTNTRYAHEAAVTLSERLLQTMPAELDRVLLVNSGSEANDIAWRLATAVSGHEGAIVTDQAYHGITASTTALSAEKWADGDRPNHVETVPLPLQRSSRQWSQSHASAEPIDAALASLQAKHLSPAAFMFDPLFTSAGIFPPNADHLSRLSERVREAGGLVIADEVQAGFGRTASHMWGFQTADVVPDIVTMGKPMGNGYPVAAVATRADISSTLCDSPGIFSTFGGNPVASVAALAVLDVIEDEQLLEHAGKVGSYLHAGLEDLAGDYDLIGEIRRSGLMIGVDLVSDAERWTPATAAAMAVVEGLRHRRVLIGTSGKHGNVLKIRPPLVFDREHADRLLEALAAVLASMDA